MEYEEDDMHYAAGGCYYWKIYANQNWFIPSRKLSWDAKSAHELLIKAAGATKKSTGFRLVLR